MENRELTQLEKTQNFALHFYGSVGLWEALEAANESGGNEAMLEAIATALLQHPTPAEA